MMNIVALVQVRAFARQDGAFLALLWIVGFLLVVLIPGSSIGSLLTLATPFLVGWMLTRFRNNVLEGTISWLRGYVYSCYTFFYASLIFAVAQYIYFRYFDQGAMMTMFLNSVNLLEQTYKQNHLDNATTVGELRQAMTLIGEMTPVQLSFIFMMQNLFIGAVASLPIALFCRRKKA